MLWILLRPVSRGISAESALTVDLMPALPHTNVCSGNRIGAKQSKRSGHRTAACILSLCGIEAGTTVTAGMPGKAY